MKEQTEARQPDVNGEGLENEDGMDAGEQAAQGQADTEGGETVAAEVDELRQEFDSLNDRHLRLAAEFDNYRKRNERERRRMAERLQADLVSSLLDVVDDLERIAESDGSGSAESVLEGVRLVEKKFRTVLETAGLEAIEADGAPFDPEVMEALMTVPTDDPERDHRVADVFQRGYRFRETMVRPARVRVWQYDESETD